MKLILTIAMGLLLLAASGVYMKHFATGVKNSAEPHDNPGEALPRRDPIANCQLLAPEDPYVDDELGANRAYAACREAAESAPGDAEVLYWLGTSALQSGRLDEAVESFHKAEQLGHCKSLYFLGDDAWYGRGDAETAEDYYKRSRACGDERAADELFSPAMFGNSNHKEQLAALYNSDMTTLNRVRFASASYLAGFYEALSEQYLGTDFEPCWTVKLYRGGEFLYGLRAAEKGDASNILESLAYEQVLPLAFHVFLPEQGSRALEEFREAERKAGHADAIRMVESSKCGALLPHKLVKGIDAFAKAKRPLIEVAREAAPHIHSQDELMDWLRQKNQQRSEYDSATR